MIAEKHLNSLKQLDAVKVKWVARKNGSKLKNFQDRFGIPEGTLNYRDILSDPEVEAVIITTPPDSHTEIFLAALDAGKHVLLEKPAAMNKADLDTMLEARRNHPELRVMDCSCRHARLQPKFRFAKQMIDEGKLGEIYYIHHSAVVQQSRPGIEYHPAAKWFLDKKQAGGGPVFDWGVYDLSFHLGLLSDRPELEEVISAFTVRGLDRVDPGAPVFDVEEHFSARFRFSGGLNYHWERATHANMESQNESRIYGSRGGIKLSFCSWDPDTVWFYDVANNGRGEARKESFEIDTSNQDDDLELAKHFVNVLQEKEAPGMPLELAAKHLEIIYQVYEAAGKTREY